jgi:hypothetical protein
MIFEKRKKKEEEGEGAGKERRKKDLFYLKVWDRCGVFNSSYLFFDDFWKYVRTPVLP